MRSTTTVALTTRDRAALVAYTKALRAPDSGSISVYGLSPQKDRNKIREWVGIQLQESAVSSIKDKGQIFLQPFPCKVLLQNALICDSKMPYYGQSEKILRHPLRRRLQ